MQKIVINLCFGGFSLSDLAEKRYAELSGTTLYYWQIPRDCPYLVQVAEELGKEANGRYAELRVVEIPSDVSWHICEYDGLEHVAENHRTWS